MTGYQEPEQVVGKIHCRVQDYTNQCECGKSIRESNCTVDSCLITCKNCLRVLARKQRGGK